MLSEKVTGTFQSADTTQILHYKHVRRLKASQIYVGTESIFGRYYFHYPAFSTYYWIMGSICWFRSDALRCYDNADELSGNNYWQINHIFSSNSVLSPFIKFNKKNNINWVSSCLFIQILHQITTNQLNEEFYNQGT